MTNFVSLDPDYTVELISGIEYDPIQHIEVSCLEAYTVNNVGSLDLILNEEDSTESEEMSIFINIWDSAADLSILANTTGGILTPEFACIETVGTGFVDLPSVQYTLVDEVGQVPTWIFIDSMTAEITYNTNDQNSINTFLIRSTLSTNPEVYYDTAFSLTVTGASGGSKEEGCFSGGSRGVWGGIIAGIILVSFIAIFLFWGAIYFIIKKSKTTDENRIDIPEPRDERVGTDQPVVNKS